MIVMSMIYISTLCGQCGPAVEPPTTQAIIKVESGGNPFVIGDNTDRRSYKLKSKEEAIQTAAELLSRGHSIDMGLMQINSIHLKGNKLTLNDVFDPCKNIQAGTNILASFYKRFDGNGDDKVITLYKALSAYNTGSAWRGPAYINKILQAAGVDYRVAVNGQVSGTKSRKSKASKKQAMNSRTMDNDGTSLFFQDGENGGI